MQECSAVTRKSHAGLDSREQDTTSLRFLHVGGQQKEEQGRAKDVLGEKVRHFCFALYRVPLEKRYTWITPPASVLATSLGRCNPLSGSIDTTRAGIHEGCWDVYLARICVVHTVDFSRVALLHPWPLFTEIHSNFNE